jgi:hypothetical protein
MNLIAVDPVWRRVRIPAEAKNSGIDHRSRDIGRKITYRSLKIKCSLRVVSAVITVEDLLQTAVVVREANKSSFQSEPCLYKSHHY